MEDGGIGPTRSVTPKMGLGDVAPGAGDTRPSVDVGEVWGDMGGGGLRAPRDRSSSSLSSRGIMGDPGLIKSSSSSSSAWESRLSEAR